LTVQISQSQVAPPVNAPGEHFLNLGRVVLYLQVEHPDSQLQMASDVQFGG
jgi:hypothetical protein